MNDLDKLRDALQRLARFTGNICESCGGSGESNGWHGGECGGCDGTGVRGLTFEERYPEGED